LPLVVRPLRRRRSWRLAASALVLSSVFVGSFVVGERTSALPASFYADADPRPNRSIALIGDSLSFAYFEGLPAEFVRNKWGPFQLEVRSGRRTSGPAVSIHQCGSSRSAPTTSASPSGPQAPPRA
jgi:hypothetical protein